jgi:hypothetical protein
MADGNITIPAEPVPGDTFVDLPSGKSDSMAEQLAEPGNLAVAMTAMANEFGAAAGRRTGAADQLAADSQRMWSIAMTSPTVSAALGFRTATEAGSGRVRNEDSTNAPMIGTKAP